MSARTLLCTPAEAACTDVFGGCLSRVTLRELPNGRVTMRSDATTREGASTSSVLESDGTILLTGTRITGTFLQGSTVAGMLYLNAESSATYVGTVTVPVLDRPMMTGFKASCYRTGRSSAPTCSYGGRSYDAGASFPDVDRCNTCTCRQDGRVACSELACR